MYHRSTKGRGSSSQEHKSEWSRMTLNAPLCSIGAEFDGQGPIYRVSTACNTCVLVFFLNFQVYSTWPQKRLGRKKWYAKSHTWREIVHYKIEHIFYAGIRKVSLLNLAAWKIVEPVHDGIGVRLLIRCFMFDRISKESKRIAYNSLI